MGKPRKYELNKIVDILSIEPEDFNEFLDDLKVYYTALHPLLKAGIGVPVKKLNFIADGKKEYKVKVVQPAKLKDEEAPYDPIK